MEKLREYYNQFLNLKFPGSNVADEGLYCFYAELVAVDAYYAGLVKKTVSGNIVNLERFNFSHIKGLRKRFDVINTSLLLKDDVHIYKECKKYLFCLEKLLRVLKGCKERKDAKV